MLGRDRTVLGIFTRDVLKCVGASRMSCRIINLERPKESRNPKEPSASRKFGIEVLLSSPESHLYLQPLVPFQDSGPVGQGKELKLSGYTGNRSPAMGFSKSLSG